MNQFAAASLAYAMAAALAGCSTGQDARILPPRPAEAAPIPGRGLAPTTPAGPRGARTAGLSPQRSPAASRQLAGNGACDATAAQRLIGQLGTVEASDQAKALTGAETVRITYPNQPLTQEYEASRLNLETDNQNRITAVRCG